MKYRGIVFDLDGTLLNTLQDLADCMNRVLATNGLPVHPVDPYRYFVGDGITNLVRRTLPEAQRSDEALVARLKGEMETEYGAHWADATRPYEGIPELLADLTRKGLRMAILSNKPHPFTLATVGRLLEGFRFDPVFGGREGVPLKPDPTAAISIAAGWRLPPGVILYAGDTATDMRTGRGAGFATVGVTWGFRTAMELREAGAHALVDRPAELLEMV
ncbi:MAG: HAD family hydrolase [Planctomycetota bacterium]